MYIQVMYLVQNDITRMTSAESGTFPVHTGGLLLQTHKYQNTLRLCALHLAVDNHVSPVRICILRTLPFL